MGEQGDQQQPRIKGAGRGKEHLPGEGRVWQLGWEDLALWRD